MDFKEKPTFKQSEVGLIPKDWEVKEIGEISSYINRGISPKYSQEGIPVLNQKCVRNGKLEQVDIKFHNSKETFSKEKIVVKDDILINSTGVGTLGRAANVKSKISCLILADSHVTIVRIDQTKADAWFVAYYLNSIQSRIEDMGEGTSGQQELSRKLVKTIKIPFPNITEQKIIAQILSHLDEKIELNQQMNKTLEAVGQAVFKRWFVDFEFPNKEGQAYKSSGGEMVSSQEVGKEIPKRWKVAKLGSCIDLDRGLSYKGAFLSEEGSPMINLGTFAPNAGFIPEGIKHYTGDYKKNQLVKTGDIVIANTDITQNRVVLGSPVIVPPNLNSEGVIFTHHVYAVRKKMQIPNIFIYYLLQLKQYRDRVIGFATGTTVLALPKDAILDFTFIMPDNQTLDAFENIANKLMEKTDSLKMQNEILTQIRDLLLPKLMSGKIRVPVSKENEVFS